MELASRWPLLDAQRVRDELLAAYGDPARGYHDLRHLAEVLDHLDWLTADLSDEQALAVRLAAWFHDGVYDGQADAEPRSADWAEAALAGHVSAETAGEVGRLVRLTATHRPDPGDAPGQALCDADLAILAAPDERYAEYVTDVRSEYAHISESDFRQGRAAILRDLLSKPTLFHTASALDRFEARARANVAAELRRLRA